MSRHPEVKWAERVDKVYLTILLPDAKNAKVNLEPDGVFTFSATAGPGNNSYEVKLNLHDKVNVEESKINTGVRSIFCVVEKKEKGWWKKLLRSDEKTPHYIKVDWDKWVDEDDDGPGDLDLGGMDFSNFGGMGGEGEGMDDEYDESDDEDQEVAKPETIKDDAADKMEEEASSKVEVKAEAAPSSSDAGMSPFYLGSKG